MQMFSNSVCRFCSCQLNGATLIQQKTDDNPEVKDFLKVSNTRYLAAYYPLREKQRSPVNLVK